MAKEQQISLSTLQMLVKLVTPAVIAPVAPIVPLAPDYSKGTEGAYGMAKDIQYMQADIKDIKTALEKAISTHVTKDEFNAQCTVIASHENLLRSPTIGLEALDKKFEVMKTEMKTFFK